MKSQLFITLNNQAGFLTERFCVDFQHRLYQKIELLNYKKTDLQGLKAQL